MTPAEFSELRYLAQKDATMRLARCIGKDKFVTRGIALLAISRRAKGNGVHPYHCNFCNQWHVGRTIALHPFSGNADRKAASHRR